VDARRTGLTRRPWDESGTGRHPRSATRSQTTAPVRSLVGGRRSGDWIPLRRGSQTSVAKPLKERCDPKWLASATIVPIGSVIKNRERIPSRSAAGHCLFILPYKRFKRRCENQHQSGASFVGGTTKPYTVRCGAALGTGRIGGGAGVTRSLGSSRAPPSDRRLRGLRRPTPDPLGIPIRTPWVRLWGGDTNRCQALVAWMWARCTPESSLPVATRCTCSASR
jgi:hypothetical protein